MFSKEMSEKNISELFENQSPKSPLSPLKRSNSHKLDYTLSISTKQICNRDKKIIVQDTPTPFMNRKTKSRIDDKYVEGQKKTFESSIKITKRVIPNTPVVTKKNRSINSKKVKKLFDNNMLLCEEELPGVEDKIKLSDNGNKVSSLFKPRSINYTEDNKLISNDTSSDQIEKKSKRRNPLIARLSDIEPSVINKDDLSNKFDQENIPSSPIIVSTGTNITDNTGLDTVHDARVSMAFKLTTINYTNSLTHVSEINDQDESAQVNQNSESNNSECYSQAVDEDKIDQILFDGLKITDQSTNKSIEKKIGLFDKTNTSKMQKSRIGKEKSLIKKSKTKNSIMDVIYPKKAATLNIAHLNLTESQKIKMKQIIKYMNSENRKNAEPPNAVFQSILKSNTSHLVIDFEAVLSRSIPKTIDKLAIILSIMKFCKIMRYEWLIHSELKRKWCPEDPYTLESYIDIDLDCLEEEQSEFDVRLVKFERSLKLTDRVDLFSNYGNIYLLSSDNENLNEVSLSDSFFRPSNLLYDYFHEIISRCNGLITSRAACADLIILIDTSNDYETKTKQGAELVLQDAIKFKKIFKEIRDKLIKCKIKKKINIISSNWVIESVLDIYDKSLDDYVICCYEGCN